MKSIIVDGPDWVGSTYSPEWKAAGRRELSANDGSLPHCGPRILREPTASAKKPASSFRFFVPPKEIFRHRSYTFSRDVPA